MRDVDKRPTCRLGPLASRPEAAALPEVERTLPRAGILPFAWGVRPRCSTNGLASHAVIPSTFHAPTGQSGLSALLRSRS